jgi:aspartyl-tRNA(Asn)/glutamyl-tRNA(Gln) amidotransferase subunit A
VDQDVPVTEPSLISVAGQVRRQQRSARDVAEDALLRIAERNNDLNAFVSVDGERALADADALDLRISRGEDVGPLAGVPLGVKDTEDTVGYRTTFGSRLWEHAQIASDDSVLVRRLKGAGCIVVGKTNTPELAAKGVTDNPLFGTTCNPHDRSRVAGGSSGGSAAAVAAGMVPIATASDGGGSIRIPASACGIPGFKPSLGRVPDGGPVPVDWLDLTTRGVLTRSVAELIPVLDVIVGPEPTDLRSLPAPPAPWTEAVDHQPMPRRIAWSPTLGYAQIDPQIVAACEAAIETLAARGVDVVEVPSVFDNDPVLMWATLVATYIRRSVGDRDLALMDPEVFAYVGMAENISTEQLIAAEDECHRMNLQLVALFESCELLLTPTLAFDPAPIDKPEMRFVTATYPFNMTRSPAGTMPVGTSAVGLPIGLQIVGPQHGDVAVLHLMREFERSA